MLALGRPFTCTYFYLLDVTSPLSCRGTVDTVLVLGQRLKDGNLHSTSKRLSPLLVVLVL